MYQKQRRHIRTVSKLTLDYSRCINTNIGGIFGLYQNDTTIAHIFAVYQNEMMQRYCITSLRFGLNVMPMIMRVIVEIVIARKVGKKGRCQQTSTIFTYVDIASGSTCHAFETERLWGGIKVMNMKIWGQKNVQRWRGKCAFIVSISTITR